MNIENTHIRKVIGHHDKIDEKLIMPTGIAELDKQIDGFGMGELVTLLGYPGDDKMNVVLRILDFQAVGNGIPSAYFCIRETPEIVARRLLCYRCSTLPNKMLEYEISGEPYEWRSWVDDNKEKIEASPIYLCSNERLSIDDICEHISSYAKNGVKVIYFYFENDVVVDDVVSRLKKIARRLLVTIVLMIDVVGTRYGIEEKQPCLQDLSWCQLDEYSDIVIGFLNCDSFGYVSEDGIDIKGQMRFQVVKDRYNKQHEHFYLSVLSMTMKQFSDTSLYSSMHQDHHQR